MTPSTLVGYHTVTIPAQQFTMIGINFQGVGGDSISVQDIFPDPLGQGMEGGTTIGKAKDRLSYWDPNEQGNYVYLWLCSSTATKGDYVGKGNKWLVYNETDALSPAAQEFWGVKNAISEAKLQPGMGLWYIRDSYAEQKTLTMAGQVTVAQSGLSMHLRNGFNMFTMGYTTDFAPNPDVAYSDPSKAIDWLSKGCAGGTTIGKAKDRLSFWDPNETGNYIYLWLCSSTATKGDYVGKGNKWLVYNETDAMSQAAQDFWGVKNEITPAVIPSGRGVWYIRDGEAFDLSLDQPYSL